MICSMIWQSMDTDKGTNDPVYIVLPHCPILPARAPSFNYLQSAYRKHHSTETPLIHLLDYIYHAGDTGLPFFTLSTSVLHST